MRKIADALQIFNTPFIVPSAIPDWSRASHKFHCFSSQRLAWLRSSYLVVPDRAANLLASVATLLPCKGTRFKSSPVGKHQCMFVCHCKRLCKQLDLARAALYASGRFPCLYSQIWRSCSSAEGASKSCAQFSSWYLPNAITLMKFTSHTNWSRQRCKFVPSWCSHSRPHSNA